MSSSNGFKKNENRKAISTPSISSRNNFIENFRPQEDSLETEILRKSFEGNPTSNGGSTDTVTYLDEIKSCSEQNVSDENLERDSIISADAPAEDTRDASRLLCMHSGYMSEDNSSDEEHESKTLDSPKRTLIETQNQKFDNDEKDTTANFEHACSTHDLKTESENNTTAHEATSNENKIGNESKNGNEELKINKNSKNKSGFIASSPLKYYVWKRLPSTIVKETDEEIGTNHTDAEQFSSTNKASAHEATTNERKTEWKVQTEMKNSTDQFVIYLHHPNK